MLHTNSKFENISQYSQVVGSSALRYINNMASAQNFAYTLQQATIDNYGNRAAGGQCCISQILMQLGNANAN